MNENRPDNMLSRAIEFKEICYDRTMYEVALQNRLDPSADNSASYQAPRPFVKSFSRLNNGYNISFRLNPFMPAFISGLVQRFIPAKYYPLKEGFEVER